MIELNDKLFVWEMLVPTVRNDGRPIKRRFHKVWDQKVLAIATGLTILIPSKGYWISKENQLYEERMIPVRIACTVPQIRLIASITKKYYEQKAIMYYLISSQVIIS